MLTWRCCSERGQVRISAEDSGLYSLKNREFQTVPKKTWPNENLDEAV